MIRRAPPYLNLNEKIVVVMQRMKTYGFKMIRVKHYSYRNHMNGDGYNIIICYLVQHDIVWFYITVSNAPLVDVLQATAKIT